MKLRPVVAGQFYPGDTRELHAVLEGFPAPSHPSPEDALAFLLPHAGYPYSGAVAALGYRSLHQVPRTVVVAGPSHYLPFRGVSIFSGEAVETPLGEVLVDQAACRSLMEADPSIAKIPAAFAREHSVEVHLPMIRYFLPGARVVPLVLGQGKEKVVKPLVRALLRLWKESPFLFVASSDLSHYPPSAIAKKADGEFLEALLTGEEKNTEAVDADIMGRGYPEYFCTHCGREPVATLLGLAKGIGADRPELLAYRNSGDVTGETDRVVGYAAVAFYKGGSR